MGRHDGEVAGDSPVRKPEDKASLSLDDDDAAGVPASDPALNPAPAATTDSDVPSAESIGEAPSNAPTESAPGALSEECSPADRFEDLVFFVHGTFSYFALDKADSNNRWRWWLHGSDFYNSLQSELPNAKLVPAGHRASLAMAPWWWRWKQSTPVPQTGVFHWSGTNSESARRTAGRRLFEHIDRVISEPANKKRRYHIISHSHGGNVVWEALRLAHEQKLKGGEKPYELADRLKSWVTVATPFMHYAADWPRLTWYLIWFVSFLCVAWITGAWWSDFWIPTQRVDTSPDLQNTIWNAPYLGSCLCFAGVHVISLCLVLFPLNMLWRLYRWIDSGAGASQFSQSEQREQTKYDFFSSLFVTMIVGAIAGASLGLLFCYLGNEQDLAYRSLRAAYSPEVLAATAWTFVLLGGLLASTCASFWVIIRGWIESNRAKSSAEAWGLLKGKHRALPIGWEHVDEPTIGLRAILEVPEDELLPRLAAPGAHRFTDNRCVRHPEFERDRADIRQWLIEFFVLAYSIPRDWIARPFYNDVFAPLIDRFVLTRLWKAAHGTDLYGARVAAVTHVPGRVVYREPWQEPTPEIWSASLRATMNEVRGALSDYLERLRGRIGLNSIAAVKVLEILEQALGDPDGSGPTGPEESRLLAHTCYLGQLDPANGSLALEIAHCLRGCTTGYVAPSLPPRPEPRKRPPCESIQYRFSAWSAQMAVLLTLVLTPACILVVTGYWLFFPWSRSALVAKASDYSTRVNRFIVNDEVGSPQSRLAWVQYFGSLPVDVAVSRLDEAAPDTPKNTLSYWQIEYAATLATRQPQNAMISLRLLDDASTHLRAEAAKNETVNRAHHLLGAIRYLSSTNPHGEFPQQVASLSKPVVDWLREKYSPAMVSKHEQEFRELNDKLPDLDNGEGRLINVFSQSLQQRRYRRCIDLLNDFPSLGNGQLSAATIIMNRK